jgi:carbon monoxide dehydrogenase subunit G
MQYTASLQVGGRIAAVGQRLLVSVARMMMRQALDALDRELQLRLDAQRP